MVTQSPASLSVTIVDGYVDEPANFGVPPYISTYPRYVAGALVDAGVPREQIAYRTIDQLREDRTHWSAVSDADLMIYVGGMTVPGAYVGGTPADPEEVRELAWSADGTSLIGGPTRFGVGEENAGRVETRRDDLDFDFLAMGDVEAAAYDLVDSGLEGFADRYRTLAELRRWAPAGAFIVEQHPNHPEYLVCELETSRGCAYRCSFCTEPLYGDPTFRDPDAVVAEVDALASRGVKHFRIGRQADLLAYGGDGRAPNPDAIERLYRGIRETAPDIETLHLDNINPVTIVEYPDRARAALKTIARYNTPGDTAAFGLESADPQVQEANNLVVSADECFEAVEIVNEIGGHRPAPDRLPKLLPGINFVHGLDGERPETFEYNQQFLERIMAADLMVRRVNIRQVMAFPGTDMAETGTEIADRNHDRFLSYKRTVRETFDQPMLERVVPAGTRLPGVHLEYHEDGRTFGRQPGTYSLLVGLPEERELDRTIDVIVVDHGYRSVTGIPAPLDPNAASMAELTAIPGIGRSRAGDIVVGRPYDALEELPVEADLNLDAFFAIPDAPRA